jgi:hypothetical protein
MKLFSPAILIFVIILSSGCDNEQLTEGEIILSIEDLLVRNNEITGWSYSGFSWVANNISELTEYINGMAEIYQRHGFEEGAQQSYTGTIDNSSRTLQLMIYNMGSESNAQEMYDEPDLGLSGATIWFDGAGTESHYVRYGGLSQVMTFYNSAYFVYLQIDYDSEESLNVLKQFALNVDGKI